MSPTFSSGISEKHWIQYQYVTGVLTTESSKSNSHSGICGKVPNAYSTPAVLKSNSTHSGVENHIGVRYHGLYHGYWI
jgi:hypothetical protein